MRKGLPAVKNLGEVRKDLEFDIFEDEQPEKAGEEQPSEERDESMAEEGAERDEETGAGQASSSEKKKVLPPKEDEYVWMWKVCATTFVPFHDFVLMLNTHSRSWKQQGGLSSCSMYIGECSVIVCHVIRLSVTPIHPNCGTHDGRHSIYERSSNPIFMV